MAVVNSGKWKKLIMRSFQIPYERREPVNADELLDIVYAESEFESFTAESFGLERYKEENGQIGVIAAVIDLEGFTHFCSAGADPQYRVPQFVGKFIDWLFDEMKQLTTENRNEKTGEVYAFAPLPFYIKFLGDGLLILWKEEIVADRTSEERQGDYGNVVGIMVNICKFKYKEFVATNSAQFNNMPKQLRCGISLGSVCVLGDGVDYVGPCINQAARLQKMGKLSFCVFRQGIDFSKGFENSWMGQEFVIKRAMIRGSGEDLIYVVREEFEELPEYQKAEFRDP